MTGDEGGDEHEVYAIKYARHHRPAANFMGGDPHDLADMPLDYFVWLVRGPAGDVVVDTGFDEAAARRRGRELLRSPAEGLKALGVDVAGVRDVVVTHMHYDHAGNDGLFPFLDLVGGKDGGRGNGPWPDAAAG